jgi:ATP-binding cassette, subfamily A (ABC1), member 3
LSSNATNVTFAESLGSFCREFVLTNNINYTTPEDCGRLQDGYGYVVQYNHTSLHGAPLFQTLADQALMRRAVGNPEAKITTTIAPLPITPLEEGLGEADDTTITWLLIMIGFPFISGACATFVVNERESKAKHLQTVAGVEPVAYWISTFLWDTINYQIPLWLVVALMFIFKVNSLTTHDNDIFSGVVGVLFFYGPAAAAYAYCWSFAFTSPSLCNIFLIVSGFLIGFAGPLTIFILTLIGEDNGNPNQNLVNIATILKWVLRPIPAFCLGNGLFSAINIDVFVLLGETPTLSVWTDTVLLYEVIFLVIQTFLYLWLAIMLDIWSSNPQVMSIWNNIFCACCSSGYRGLDITTALPEDDDVIAEQDRVNSGGANNDLIVVSQLTKIYRNGKIAVNSLSLGIPPGECFGLLGINGKPLCEGIDLVLDCPLIFCCDYVFDNRRG